MNQITCCVNRTQVDPSVLIKQTLKIAQFFEASVLFVKVFDKDLESSNEDQSVELRVLRDMVNDYLGKEHSSIPVSCSVSYGDLMIQLNQIIQEENVDLLVLGTNREGFWYRYLYGDDSINVAQKLPCPVLLIPIVEHEFAIKRIVYSTQLVYNNLDSLSRLKLWAAAFRAKVYCIHVYGSEHELQDAQLKMDELSTYFGNDRFEYHLIKGNLYEAIADQADLTHSDLIVSLHRRREWWAAILHKSKSKHIYKQLRIPMLFFKD